MHHSRVASCVLSAALVGLFAQPLSANTTYTWSPNPSGPYGFDYINRNAPVNGTLTATNGGNSFYNFNFGDGPQAGLFPGVIHDTGPGLGSASSLWEFDFKTNGYTFAATASSDYQIGLTLSVAPNITATWNAPGNGILQKNGSGTLLLDSPFARSAAGGTSLITIADGTLQTMNPNLFANQNISIAAAAALALGGNNQSLSSITNDGEITSAGGSITVTTLINNGNITTTPSAPAALDGDLTTTSLSGSGQISLDGTFLTTGGNATLDTYTGNITGNGSLFKSGTGELVLLGNTSLTGTRGAPAITVEAGTLAGNTSSLTHSIVLFPGATLLFAQSTSAAFSGNITGNGTVTADGLTRGIVLTFGGPNTFVGNLDLASNIILAVSNDNQLGTFTSNGIPHTLTYATLTFDGGTLRTTAPLTIARPIAVTQFGGTLDTNGLASTFTSSITSTGNGTLTIAGGGTATFTGSSLALNQLAVSNATLNLTSVTANITNTLSVAGISTITLANTSLQSGDTALAANASDNVAFSLSGAAKLWGIGGNLDLGKNGSSGRFGTAPGVASLSFSKGITLSVAGTTTLNANSTITVSGGIFSTGALANSAGSNPAIAISDAGSPALVIGSDAAPTSTYAGNITNTLIGAGSLHKVGANTQTLSGIDTYSGATTIDAGNLIIASSSALPAASLVTNNATLTFSTPTATANTISGTGTLTISANDRLTLAGAGASKQSALALNSLSLLDIGAHPFILEPVALIRSKLLNQLRSEVASAKVSAGGITSSTVNASPTQLAIAVIDNATLPTPFTTFGGQSVDPNSILIAPELLGDANVDGTVNLTDLNTVLNHLGQATPNWTDGNFDGNPTIDLTDLDAVLNNLGVSFANFNSVLAAESLFATPTPEPAPLVLLATLALPLLARRRRTP